MELRLELRVEHTDFGGNMVGKDVVRTAWQKNTGNQWAASSRAEKDKGDGAGMKKQKASRQNSRGR